MQLRFDYRIDIVTIVCRLDEEIKNEDKIRKNTEFLHKTSYNFIFNHKKNTSFMIIGHKQRHFDCF